MLNNQNYSDIISNLEKIVSKSDLESKVQYLHDILSDLSDKSAIFPLVKSLCIDGAYLLSDNNSNIELTKSYKDFIKNLQKFKENFEN